MTPTHAGIYTIKDHEGVDRRCEVEWDRGYRSYRVRVEGRPEQWRGTNSIGRFLRGQDARRLTGGPETYGRRSPATARPAGGKSTSARQRESGRRRSTLAPDTTTKTQEWTAQSVTTGVRYNDEKGRLCKVEVVSGDFARVAVRVSPRHVVRKPVPVSVIVERLNAEQPRVREMRDVAEATPREKAAVTAASLAGAEEYLDERLKELIRVGLKDVRSSIAEARIAWGNCRVGAESECLQQLIGAVDGLHATVLRLADVRMEGH